MAADPFAETTEFPVSMYGAKMKVALIATALASLFLVPSASAVELVNPDGSVAQPYQAWADAARVPTSDSTIVVQSGLERCGLQPRPGVQYHGCSAGDEIVLWQRCETMGSLANRRRCRFVFWHELGHHYSRQMSHRLRGAVGIIAGQDWDDPTASPVDGTLYPRELFADAYASCQIRREFVDGMSMNGVGKQRLRICKMLLTIEAR